MKRTLIAAGALVALAGAAAPARAQQTYLFATSVGTQPSNVGTVRLTQVNATTVNVFVDLLTSSYGFINTGGPHTPFAFNLAGSTGGVTATFLQPAGGSYTFGLFTLSTAGGSNTPYGTYGIAINSSAGNGSGNAYYGDLSFDVTRTGGLTTNDFTTTLGNNGTPYYFSADLTNGQNTGSQAWGVRTAVIPEPSTAALLGVGALGLGLARSRRRAT